MSLSISATRSAWPVGLGIAPPQTPTVQPSHSPKKPETVPGVDAVRASAAKATHVYAKPVAGRSDSQGSSDPGADTGTDPEAPVAQAADRKQQHREAVRLSVATESARSALRAWSDNGTAHADAAWINSSAGTDQSAQDLSLATANAAYAMVAGVAAQVQSQASSVRRSA